MNFRKKLVEFAFWKHFVVYNFSLMIGQDWTRQWAACHNSICSLSISTLCSTNVPHQSSNWSWKKEEDEEGRRKNVRKQNIENKN